MRILITGGPTREPIDAVRFIANRSSGATGLAVAAAAAEAGHDVTLLLGPGPMQAQLPESSAALRVHRFETSDQLRQLLEAHFGDHDVLIMAAAVADYRPARVAEGKLPRQADQPLVLHLEPTPDLVAMMAQSKRPEQRIVAFALEAAAELEARAIDKLRTKRVDAIVANALDTIEADFIAPVWLTAGGQGTAKPHREAPGRMTKARFARWLIERISRL